MNEVRIMADYREMYSVLCKAIDDVIEPLEQLQYTRPIVLVLRRALLDAEEIYINTTPHAEVTEIEKITELQIAWDQGRENWKR